MPRSSSEPVLLKTPKFAVAREVQRVCLAWMKHGVWGLPVKISQAVLKDPVAYDLWDESRLIELFSENILEFVNALGPIYGKAAQMVLSRLSPKLHTFADTLRLTRLYKDWPPIPFARVQEILDAEVPRWRSRLRVEETPLGVASIAQVHACMDEDGKEWVIKIIKPKARQRLLESVAALEEAKQVLVPFAVTLFGKRLLREIQDLCDGFRRELDLELEAQTILRMHEKITNLNAGGILHIPKVRKDLSSKNVLTLEKFSGTSLADIVSGKVAIDESTRKRLAHKILQELLVQVFEVGLFHADPHAGNLILRADGSIGLFDWGLSGELLESDRRHIAGMLKAVMAQDLDQLATVLEDMAKESGHKLSQVKIKKELAKLSRWLQKRRAGEQKVGLQELVEQSLKAADKLRIPVPNGLLLMAKSLVTIEGLARGIDPKVSMARAATPVLWRAAKPTFKDLFKMSKKFPGMARKMFFGKN